MTVTPAAPPPPAITKVDVQKLAEATALIVPLIPKSWVKSSIIWLSIANALQLGLAAVTGLMPPNVSISLAVVLSIVVGILRVVNPNPPIAGSNQDLTKGK